MHSHSPDKGTVTLQSELRKHEFFMAMIAVAVYLNITCSAKQGQSAARARGRRGSVQLSPAEALQKLYDEAFFPYIEKHLDGTSIKAALGTDEVLLLFKEKDEELQQVFTLYGDR